MRLFPSLKQWSQWSLPSKLTALGTLIGAVSLGLYLIEKGISFSSSSELPPETPIPVERVFAHCQMVVMRTVMPPEGHIYVLQPQEQPEGIGGGLTDFFGPPGSQWNQTDSKGLPAWGYRCELTNHSSSRACPRDHVHIRVHIDRIRPEKVGDAARI